MLLLSYRTFFTILVTVTLAKESFSKVKLMKTFIRAIASQERLSGSAMISIENEYFDKLKYDGLIEKNCFKTCKKKLFSLNWIVV